jgi:hypothetical protein
VICEDLDSDFPQRPVEEDGWRTKVAGSFPSVSGNSYLSISRLPAHGRSLLWHATAGWDRQALTALRKQNVVHIAQTEVICVAIVNNVGDR